MKSFLNLKKEVRGFSRWFRIAFFVMFVVYICIWFWTIHLATIQRAQNLEPVLPSLGEDSAEYVNLSQSMLTGNGFRLYNQPETTRVPGYPTFISVLYLVGGSYFLVTLVQVLLVFATAIIVRRIGTIFSSKTVGEISAFLLIINPVTVTLSLVILTDILFMFLFVWGFYKALELNEKNIVWKTCIVSFIFVLAIYVRGMGLFALPIFIAPIVASKIPWRMQWKAIVTLILCVLVTIAPWVWRNYTQVGVADFNSFKSVNLSWSVPKFLSLMKGTTEEYESTAFHLQTGIPEEKWHNFDWHSLKYSDQITKVAEKIIWEHPFAYIKFHIVTSLPFLFPSTIQYARDTYLSTMHERDPFSLGIINNLASGDVRGFLAGLARTWWKFAERLLWLLLCILTAYALWRDRRKPLAWACVFVIGYLMMLTGVAAGPRLSLQAWPYMFVLSVTSLVYIWKCITKTK